MLAAMNPSGEILLKALSSPFKICILEQLVR